MKSNTAKSVGAIYDEESERQAHYRELAGAAAARRHRSTALRRVNFWLAGSDAASFILSWLLSLAVLRLVGPDSWWDGIVAWWTASGESRATLFFGLLALMLLLFAARGHYSRRRPVADEALDIFKIFLLVAVVDAVLAYLGKAQFSRAWFISAWCLALIILPLARTLTKRLLMRSGRWRRSTVILGAGQNAREAARALQSEPLMGLEPIAFLTPPGETVAMQALEVGGRQVPVQLSGEDLELTLENLNAPHLVVAMEAESLFAHEKLIQRLAARYVDLSIIPPLRGLPLYGMEMTHFFSHEVLMLNMRNNLARPGPQFLKRAFDVIASLSLLVVLSPVFAYLSWRIRQSGGPAIYGHERVGRHGTAFRCLKFRTMVPDADRVLAELLARDPEARNEWRRDFKLKDDPRITSIGAVLRETSLDELPQLWNVLKGEMSMVGPRPIVEDELTRYGDQVGYYLEASPGMTGLWQISGRSQTGYEDRVALDCWYVRNWSLWYDLVILLKTVRIVLARQGAY